MNIFQTLVIALKSISGNKLRSALTVLGIVIGVAAVIAMLGIGRGAQASITANISSTGTNLLFVYPGAARTNGVAQAAGSSASLTLADATALQGATGVAAVAPEVDGRAQVVYQGLNTNSRVVGVTDSYMSVRNLALSNGSFISAANVTARTSVVVLGSNVANSLFGDPTAGVGSIIKVSGQPFKVIGVLVAKGGTGFGSQDDQIIVPITTAQTKLIGQQRQAGSTSVNSINVQALDAKSIPAATAAIGNILRQRHKVLAGAEDFTVQSQADLLTTLSSVTNTLTVFLGGIAGISLVVGGIGVMNIMLVSVTERTREIGIRKAIGARRRDILTQFLLESAGLSLLGGVIGIALGWGIAASIGTIQLGGSSVKPLVGLDSILLATTFSAAIGLFFGIYPAMRASSLRPVEALRYE